ncbi:MAG: hypothetical protein O2955_12975 [Planctomycetota bacterium]|nr:hypothetical protein [Planctomycetota bacterium]MDA1213422.1 hypothetical protein [Planctomycetota bacterium]
MYLSLKRSTDVVSLCIAAVIFTLLLPWIIGVGMGSSPDTEARKQQIEKMSADARQHLEANLIAYENSPPYLRDEFKALSEAIERDPELAEMLDEYCTWIQSLPPEQQKELREPNEPNDRINLVMKYLHRIPSPPDRHPSDKGPQPQQNWAASWVVYVHHVMEFVERDDRLTNEELAAVVDLLEKQGKRNASRPDSAVTNSKPLWERGITVLDELSRRTRPVDQQAKQELRSLSDRVSRVITTSSVVKRLNNVKQSPVQFQQQLRQVVVCSLLGVLIDDLTETVSPSDFPPEFRDESAPMRGIQEKLTPQQRQKRIALFYRLTRGQAGYERQIAAFKKLIPKNYLGRERLNDEGFPHQPGGRMKRPRPEDGPPPRFSGPADEKGRYPSRPFRPGEGRDPPPQRPQ